MKTTEKERLLKEALNNESYLAFRAGLFEDMLGNLRRQRAARNRRPLLALAACVPMAVGLYLLLSPRTSPLHQPPSVAVVRTVPLAAEQIVRTVAMNRPTTTTEEHVLIVTSSATNIEIFRTSAQVVELLTDEQLLELFKGQPVALVTVGPGERHLVLPQDSEQPR